MPSSSSISHSWRLRRCRLSRATISRALEVPIWVYAMAAALAICGTTLAKPVLHRFSNEAFQLWSRRLVLGIGAVYLVQGGAGLRAVTRE